MAQNNVNCDKNMQRVDSRPTLIRAKDSRHISVRRVREMLRRAGACSLPERVAPQCPRDFTAYFQSSTKVTDPTYCVTSHNTRGQTQALRWNPTLETTSIESCHEPERNMFLCKCNSCTSKRCPSKGYLDTTDNYKTVMRPLAQNNCTPRPINMNARSCGTKIPAVRNSGYKDNIMRFNDQCTMTLKLADTCIGCTPTPSQHVSDASATTSDIAVKETHGSMRIHDHSPIMKSRSPILKNRRLKSAECPSYSGESSNHTPCTSDIEESRCTSTRPCYIIHPSRGRLQCQEISDELEFESSQDKRSTKQFFKCRRKRQSTEKRCSRKIIYNEGISDLVAQQYPVLPVHDSHMQVQMNYSKSCVKSKSRLDEECSQVPYSHRSDSKYHANCKKTRSKHFLLEHEEARHLQSPEAVMRSFMYRKTNCHNQRAPAIQLPKRVLTSDRDIDAFIEAYKKPKSCQKMYVPPRCVRHCTYLHDV